MNRLYKFKFQPVTARLSATSKTTTLIPHINTTLKRDLDNFKPYHKSQQSSKNSETFNETTLSEDLGSNPDLISNIQDNLREYDKLQGLSLDKEHSNTLKGPIKGLKVVMNETKESINQGNDFIYFKFEILSRKIV